MCSRECSPLKWSSRWVVCVQTWLSHWDSFGWAGLSLCEDYPSLANRQLWTFKNSFQNKLQWQKWQIISGATLIFCDLASSGCFIELNTRYWCFHWIGYTNKVGISRHGVLCYVYLFMLNVWVDVTDDWSRFDSPRWLLLSRSMEYSGLHSSDRSLGGLRSHVSLAGLITPSQVVLLFISNYCGLVAPSKDGGKKVTLGGTYDCV